MGECIGFNVSLDSQHTIGHFGDEIGDSGEDDVTQLMIPVRKTWNKQNVVGAVSEEVDSKEMSSEKNDL